MKTLKIKSAKIKVAIAKTTKEQQQGLMHVKTMPCNHGMLFEFPKEQILSFWMKNTTLPLSIAFIDKNHKIVEIKEMEPLSEESIKSSVPAKWALETNKGWFLRNNIKIGDKVSRLSEGPIKIRVVKLPPEAFDLAKEIEDLLISMTSAAIKTKLGVGPGVEDVTIDGEVEE